MYTCYCIDHKVTWYHTVMVFIILIKIKTAFGMWHMSKKGLEGQTFVKSLQPYMYMYMYI